MAEFGIIGDENFGMNIPESQVDTQGLAEERKAAKFSRTAEFRKLKEHLESRIAFYQRFLPDGRPVVGEISTNDWIIANTLIREFKAILDDYQTAAEAVKEADGR